MLGCSPTGKSGYISKHSIKSSRIIKVLKHILIALLGILTLALVVGLFLPSKYHLERPITIQAPASKVFQEVKDFRQGKHWSPWQGLDPNMVVQYEGPSSGVGSKMLGSCKDPKVAKGRQEIIISEPNKRIVIRLNFEGWSDKVTAGFSFEEQGVGMASVTWTNASDVGYNVLYQYLRMVFNSTIEQDYDKGLQLLQAHVEQHRAGDGQGS